MGGNVRTQTLPAFSADDMAKMLAKLNGRKGRGVRGAAGTLEKFRPAFAVIPHSAYPDTMGGRAQSQKSQVSAVRNDSGKRNYHMLNSRNSRLCSRSGSEFMQKPPPTQWPDVLEQQHVEGCSVFANRKLLIESLAACRGGTICEIGVEYGFFSEFLLRTLQPKLFHAFDLFDLHNQERHGEHRPKDIFQGRTHLQYYTRKFNAQIHDGTLKAFMGDSSEYLSDQPDQFYDLIYVDGDHTLEGVKKDTDVAVEKIKPEGVLVFSDYIMSDCVNPWVATYGVVQAVNDLCINHGWRMHAFALQSSMFCDVALVRR